MRKHAPVVILAAALAFALSGLLAPVSADARRIRAFVYHDWTQPAQAVKVEDFRVNETIFNDGGVEFLWVRGPGGNYQLSLHDIRQIEVIKWLGPDTTVKVDWVRYEVKVTGTNADVVHTGVIEIRVMRGIAGKAPWYYYPATEPDRGSKLWRVVFGSEDESPTLPLPSASYEVQPNVPRAAEPVPMPPPAPEPPAEAPPPAPMATEDDLFARMSLDELNTRTPLGVVFFSFDSDEINAFGQDTLTRNAEWLKRWPSTRVRITGQADPRGTNEYNLDLGQRRAEAVRAFLVGAGVPANRLEAVSTGKLQLVCTEQVESCWSRNRRAHFLFTAK